jgi:hypothetical protein
MGRQETSLTVCNFVFMLRFGRPLFIRRLDAVRWAFRHVASIMIAV